MPLIHFHQNAGPHRLRGSSLFLSQAHVHCSFVIFFCLKRGPSYLELRVSASGFFWRQRTSLAWHVVVRREVTLPWTQAKQALRAFALAFCEAKKLSSGIAIRLGPTLPNVSTCPNGL